MQAKITVLGDLELDLFQMGALLSKCSILQSLPKIILFHGSEILLLLNTKIQKKFKE